MRQITQNADMQAGDKASRIVAMLTSSGDGPNISGVPDAARVRAVEMRQVRRDGAHSLTRALVTSEQLREMVAKAYRQNRPTEIYDRETGEQIGGVVRTLEGRRVRWVWWSE